MNVYDEAHNLERAIRESEEWKQYDAAKKKVDANPELKKMIDDFSAKQMEMQIKQSTGEEVSQEMMQAVQQLYSIVAADPVAAEFIQCQMRLSIMMQDVFQILGDVMGIGTGKNE